jgi:hypothetical protein
MGQRFSPFEAMGFGAMNWFLVFLPSANFTGHAVIGF